MNTLPQLREYLFATSTQHDEKTLQIRGMNCNLRTFTQTQSTTTPIVLFAGLLPPHLERGDRAAGGEDARAALIAEQRAQFANHTLLCECWRVRSQTMGPITYKRPRNE